MKKKRIKEDKKEIYKLENDEQKEEVIIFKRNNKECVSNTQIINSMIHLKFWELKDQDSNKYKRYVNHYKNILYDPKKEISNNSFLVETEELKNLLINSKEFSEEESNKFCPKKNKKIGIFIFMDDIHNFFSYLNNVLNFINKKKLVDLNLPEKICHPRQSSTHKPTTIKIDGYKSDHIQNTKVFRIYFQNLVELNIVEYKYLILANESSFIYHDLIDTQYINNSINIKDGSGQYSFIIAEDLKPGLYKIFFLKNCLNLRENLSHQFEITNEENNANQDTYNIIFESTCLKEQLDTFDDMGWFDFI